MIYDTRMWFDLWFAHHCWISTDVDQNELTSIAQCASPPRLTDTLEVSVDKTADTDTISTTVTSVTLVRAFETTHDVLIITTIRRCSVFTNLSNVKIIYLSHHQWNVGLAINRSWVQFPSGQSYVTTLGKLFTIMCPWHQQYNLVLVEGRWHSSAGKVTAGLAESNGSLPLGRWLKSPMGWLPAQWYQLRAQRLVTSMALAVVRAGKSSHMACDFL